VGAAEPDQQHPPPRQAGEGLEIRESHTVCQLIRTHAERTPDAIALLAPERAHLSYGKLLRQVEQVVQTLHRCGIGRKDRVAVVLPNGPEMAVAFLGVSAAATCAPLNPAYRASECEFYLTDLKAKALLVLAGADLPARAVAVALGIPIMELTPAA